MADLSNVAEIAGVGPGDVVAEKYRIDSVLGVGGMGVVFRARHLQLNGLFALKFLSRECLSNAQAIGRFQREAQAAAKLKSDHVVRVFDVGVHVNGLPYIVMEYLEGGDLSRLLQSMGPLPVEQAVDFLLQTCSAVAHAHREGIIHRDLKPSNLFCVARADGGLLIKIVDFGISKLTGSVTPGDEGVTVTGNFIGSPSYMSPEQMKAPNRVDSRTDIWSMGVVLYECLTGRLPFPAGSYPEICLRVTQDPPVPLASFRADVPAGLEAIILKCLQKERDQRFSSAIELSKALREFAPATAPSSPPDHASAISENVKSLGSWPAKAKTPGRNASFSLTQPSWVRTAQGLASRRRPALLTLSAVALLALVLGAAIIFRKAKSAAEDSSALASSAQPSAIDAGSSAAQSGAPRSVPTAMASSGPAVGAPSAESTRGAAGAGSALPLASTTPGVGTAPTNINPNSFDASTPGRASSPAALPKTPPRAKPLTERDAKSPIWNR